MNNDYISKERKEKQLANINRMSKLLLERQELLNKLEAVLSELDAGSEEFKELSEYFISEQRMNDIDDDENGEIPDNINKAALTQDELYNLIMDSHDTAIHMMESAVQMLKQK